MAKAYWATQCNLVNQRDLLKLESVCDDHPSAYYYPFRYAPFSNNIDNVQNHQPTVFYGSTNLTRLVYDSSTWDPGVFFDPIKFNFNTWRERYDCVNKNARVTTIAKLARETHHSWDKFFLRPVADSKEFAGEVMSFMYIQDWCTALEKTECTMDSSCEIVVADPVNITIEWRFFLVKGVVIAGSRYRSNGRLNTSPKYSKPAATFAETQAQLYAPDDVFVMDVGWLAGDKGGHKVIEVNCFNSSGFYEADIAMIVDKVSEVALNKYWRGVF